MICTLQLIFNKLYIMFLIKIMYLTAIIIFKIDLLICDAAFLLIILIIEYALINIECVKIYCNSLIIIAHIVSLHQDSLFIELISNIYDITLIADSLLDDIFINMFI